MLQKEIQKYLQEINDELALIHLKGEICLYGGAIMCLVFKSRPSTKDVDAIFEPAKIIKDIAQKIAERNALPEDWLNDGVKGFMVDHQKKILFDWSNLKVYFADTEYLLAMKALASRVDATDREDIIFLIKELGISSPEEVFAIIEKYYPRKEIRPVTQFFIEEIFENEYNR